VNTSRWHVWDSANYPRREIYPRFREEIASQQMFFLPTLRSKEDDFHYRVSLREGGKGRQVFRMSCSQFDNRRSRSEIARSTIDTFCGVFGLRGSMTVVRGDTHQVIKPGELFLYDSADPVTLCHGAQEQIGFIVEKSSAPALEKKCTHSSFS
jgi:hypothetical protein